MYTLWGLAAFKISGFNKTNYTNTSHLLYSKELANTMNVFEVPWFYAPTQ